MTDHPTDQDVRNFLTLSRLAPGEPVPNSVADPMREFLPPRPPEKAYTRSQVHDIVINERLAARSELFRVFSARASMWDAASALPGHQADASGATLAACAAELQGLVSRLRDE